MIYQNIVDQTNKSSRVRLQTTKYYFALRKLRETFKDINGYIRFVD